MFNSKNKKKNDFLEMRPLLDKTMGLIEEGYKHKTLIKGISTGVRDLDRLGLSLQNGDLAVVLGRPSMGKTAFVLNIAVNVAVTQKIPVLFISLDDVKEELALRLICLQSQTELHKARRGFLNEIELAKLTGAAGYLSDHPLYVIDYAKTMKDIEKTIREFIKKKNIKVVILDQLQMIESERLYSVSRVRQAADENCMILKGLARKYNIPILLTSKLSRAFESKPGMARSAFQFNWEAGNLLENADNLMMLYREEYYDPTDFNRGRMHIRTPKTRYGTISAQVTVHFDKSTGRITAPEFTEVTQ